MLIDTRAEFCAATPLDLGGAGSYIIGNTINLSDIASDLGVGAKPLYLVIQMATTADSGGLATGTFALVTDSATNFPSAVVIGTTAAIPVASLIVSTQVVQGFTFILPLPPKAAYEQYLAIRQTTAVSAFSEGSINAFLTTDISAWKAYDNGVAS